MMKQVKPLLLATTVIAGAFAAMPAFAQSNPAPTVPTAPVIGGSSASALPTDPAQPASESGQDIVVTGSRIANAGAVSPSPLTTVSAQEIRLEGVTRTEDLLNNLPSVFSGQGGNLSNGSNGTATVDLRGLGSQRTLVLVNGRRLMPGDPVSSAADLNFVPAALIDRVDLLTGGASSTYGSDAISGVVNFVMNTRFEGVRLDAQYSLFDHDNNNATADNVFRDPTGGRGFAFPQGHTDVGATQNITAVIGTGGADGRSHVVAYAGYRQIQAVTQDSYDYSACSLAEVTTSLGFNCSGSGTTSPARFILNGGAGAQVTLNPATGNTFRPYVGSRDAFNFAPYNYYQRPDKRYTAGVFADYEITPAFDPYIEFMFMDDRSTAQIAPSGIFGQVININCNNPLLSASEATAICGANAGSTTATGAVSIGKRNVEGGGRINDLRHTDYRYVVGMKGQIDPAFSYDGYLQFGRVVYAENYQNDFSVNRTRNALNDITVNGQIVCADVNARAQGCVPYNLFAVGGVTQGALNYLQTPGFQQGTVDEYVADFSITGDLGKYGIKSPFADNGIGINVGTEYRKEQLQLLTDSEFTSGDLAGQGGPTIGVAGSFNVYEFFGEARVPLIENKTLFQSLVATAGYRRSHYNLAGNTDTYKGGVEWKPVSPLLLRASYNRAVRAPNIQELFAPAGQSLFTGTDPCAGTAINGTVNGNSAAACARTGVTGAEFGNIVANSANQYTQFSGGNVNLKPEVSDTYSAGAVIAPREGVLRGLVISADYFNIKVKGAISTVGAQIILNQCLATGSSSFCSLVQRDPTNGSLFLGTVGQVVNTTINVGQLQTRGVDVAGSYRFDFERAGLHNIGSLGLDYTGTFLINLKDSPGTTLADGTTTFDCAGYYGVVCSAANGTNGFAPAPKYRSKLRVTYNAPSNFQISLNWRHLSGVNVDASSPNSFLSRPSLVFASDSRLPAYNYFDLSTSVRIADKFSLHVGANNITDKDPPLVGSNNLSGTIGNGNTYPQVWDSLGRYIFAGVTVDF
ncbi:TonB-dependent receptor domain-containing protein [Sphingomonas bacterium]|uniref:TonB-dependent receptor domain-containing protein n=1 Tax=Sphingomonas bacterium TaxID=1895847 RepID=UPI0015775BC3|nr:TonB-dependent receptor [Sphingomonas bacterium]